MTEKEEFRVVDAALRAFAADPPPVRPVGSAATRAFVRRRHQARVAVGVAALALAVSVPVVGYAALGPGGDHIASDPPSASAVPSPYPTLSSSPWVNPSPETTDPLSQFTVEQLRTAVFDIPAWGRGADSRCPTGRFQMRGARTPVAAGIVVDVVQTYLTQIDVADPAFETAALLWCGDDAERQFQVIALDRGDPIRTIGQVVSTSADGPVRTVFALSQSFRNVGVVVGDAPVCCGVDHRRIGRQARGYAWTGSGFRQTDGPTAFAPDRPGIDVAVDAGPLKVSRVQGRVPQEPDSWQGSVDVVVTNRSSTPAEGIWVQVSLDGVKAAHVGGVSFTPFECRTVPPGGTFPTIDPPVAICHLGALDPGATVTVPLQVMLDTTADPARATATYEAYEEQPRLRMLSDPNPADNVKTTGVTTG